MFRSVQYLRAVAAIAIVVVHASHPGGPLESALRAGVDLFFVISGFIMVISTEGKPARARDFLLRRAQRILPLWWVALLTVALLGLGQGGPVEWAMSTLLLPYAINPVGHGMVSWGVGWTLVFEAVFYAIFAVGLALGRRSFAPVALLVLVAAGLTFGRPDMPLAAVATHPLLLEFLLGIAAARLVLAGIVPSPWLVPVGLTMLAAGLSARLGLDARALTLGLPLAVTMLGLIGLERRGRLPDWRALGFLGDASYAIYLFHYAPIMLVWTVLPKDSFWIMTAILGIVVGCVAHLAIERPLLRFFREQGGFSARFLARKATEP